MKQFLTPYNSKFYDALGAYKSLEEIDWGLNSKKIQVNDEILFYWTKPIQKIAFRGIVTKINIPYDESIDDSEFNIGSKLNESESKKEKTFTRIKMTEIFDEQKQDMLSFKNLQENGMKGSLMSTRILDNTTELAKYINKIIEN